MPIGSDKGFIVKPGFDPLATQTSELVAAGIWTWGYNNFGQLGVDNTTSYSSPIQVGASDWTKTSPGGQTTHALNHSGGLYTSGKNSNGQLGQNNTTA